MKVLDIIRFGFYLIINSKILAFNIDTNFPVIFKGETDSMFGFSLAIAEQDSKIWLYVGDPRGNKLVKESNKFLYQNRAGSIHLCNASYVWSDEKVCSEMEFPKEKDDSIHDMTGFSMTVVPHPNTDKPNKILFCAPLWSKKFSHLGKCYQAKIGEIKNIAPTVIPKNISVDSRFVYLSAGFSVYSFKNGDVSYGIPGANNCSGLIFIDKSSTGTQVNVKINSKVTPSYLGFSIYTGRFTTIETEFLIGGAPKYNDTGRVDIFNELYSSIWNEIGSQMGSYFGAALCAVDINNDGCDDLLIGSPMYKAKIAMEGKVNVYISQCTLRVSFWEPKSLFGSKGRNAQFGNAIADVGDLNNDLYKDVVIGAPFEDDNIGCIYIYNGGKNGLLDDKVQRICGGTIKSLSGFGWSISKSVDVDKNGYNDFAVSALISNKVAILRGRPIIEVLVDMDLNNANLSESNIINITLTFLYNTKYSSSNDLVLGFKLEVDAAAVRSNKRLRLSDSIGSDTEIEEKITLKRNESISKTFTAVLKSNIADFLTPLKFNLSYCIHSHKNFVDKLRPIFSRKKSILKVLRFEKQCLSDDECKADLVLLMRHMGRVFVNETKKITLQVTVLNHRDDAFSTIAVFKFGDKISYYGVKNIGNGGVSCLEQRERVECDIANPLSKGEKVEFLLEFKVSIIVLEEIDQPIVVDGEVKTQSEEERPIDNIKQLKIPLELIAVPELTEKTASTPVKYNKEDKLSINNSDPFVMATDFIIHNLGPSYLPETTAVFSIPMTVPGGNMLFTSTDIQVTRENISLECDIKLEGNGTNPTISPLTTTQKDLSTLRAESFSKESIANVKSNILVTKQAITGCQVATCFMMRCKVPVIAAYKKTILSLHLNFSNAHEVFKIFDYLQIAIDMEIINEANIYLAPWKKIQSITVQLSFLADMLSGKPINYIWVAAASAAGAFCCIMFLWFLIWKYRCCVTKMQREIHVIKRESIKRRTRRQTSHEGVQYKSMSGECSSKL